jgi:hypothetical protein
VKTAIYSRNEEIKKLFLDAELGQGEGQSLSLFAY